MFKDKLIRMSLFIFKKTLWIFIIAGIVVLVMLINFITSIFSKDSIGKFEDYDPYPVILNEELSKITGQGMQEVISNGEMALSVDFKTGHIILEDLATGTEWKSMPELEFIENDFANQVWKTNLKSSVIVEYVQDYNAATSTYGNTVNFNAEIQIFTISENGIRVHYVFGDTGLEMSVDIYLSKNNLEVIIPFYMIKEPEIILRENVQGEMVIDKRSFYRITNIQVFPFFDASPKSANESGYLFVPDGPGGIIEFRENRQYRTEFIGEVYGRDFSYVNQFDASTNLALNTATVYYPVFGLKKENRAYLAIIHEGGEYSTIHGVPADIRTGFNQVFSNFTIRKRYKVVTDLLGGGYFRFAEDSYKYSPHLYYSFLTGESANYSSMAGVYRNYLINSNSLSDDISVGDKSDLPLQLTIFCGDLEKRLLGNSLVSVTSFEDAKIIVSDLIAEGITNMDITLKGWKDDGAALTYPKKAEADRNLGGDRGLKDFVQFASENGFSVYLTDNYFNAYSFSRISKRNDTAYNIHGAPLNIKRSGNRNDIFILSPKSISGILESDMSKYENYGISGLDERGIGKILVTDFNPKQPLSRRMVKQEYSNLINSLRDNFGSVRIGEPSAYLIGENTTFSEMVFLRSFSPIIDEIVPFYQMSLNGLLNYNTKPFNLFDEPRIEFLKAIEEGANVQFIVTAKPTRLLKNTGSNNLYSTEYILWKNIILETYEEINNIYSITKGHFIVSHEKVMPGVIRVKYENDIEIVINYNAYPVIYNEIKIDSTDYLIFEQR